MMDAWQARRATCRLRQETRDTVIPDLSDYASASPFLAQSFRCFRGSGLERIDVKIDVRLMHDALEKDNARALPAPVGAQSMSPESGHRFRDKDMRRITDLKRVKRI
jgi:hypothetical protein